MSDVAFERPVGDSVPKINDEIAVGEDLEFQRRWWKFEKAVWILFSLLLLATLCGLFGRGPLAKAQAANEALTMRYERVERTGTPSMLTVDFQQKVIQDGKVHLFVSQSLVQQLGAQRIIPEPESSAVGQGGITYTFAATRSPASVQFELQPAGPGSFSLSMADPDLASAGPLAVHVLVLP